MTNPAKEKPTILLTGFGPFGIHNVNASELAVKQLLDSDLATSLGVNLVTQILDVDYKQTKEIVPVLWQKHCPKLVVHVGVSSEARMLTLEEQAQNRGYEMLDNARYSPNDGCCVPNGSELLRSSLALSEIRDRINQNPSLKLKCKLSQDPGKYLCSYVYYTSLHQNCSNSLFIHVPTLDVSPAEDTAASLSEAITLLYQSIVNKEPKH